jgi:hypothetical protein
MSAIKQHFLVKSFFEVLKSVKLLGGLQPCYACSVLAAAKPPQP